MNSAEILKTLNGVLNTVSSRLGIAANAIYPVLLKQTQVDLIQHILVCILCVVLMVGSVVAMIKLNKAVKAKEIDDDNEMIIIFLLVITLIIASIFFMTKASTVVQIWVNPQYYIFSNYLQPLIQQQ